MQGFCMDLEAMQKVKHDSILNSRDVNAYAWAVNLLASESSQYMQKLNLFALFVWTIKKVRKGVHCYATT